MCQELAFGWAESALEWSERAELALQPGGKPLYVPPATSVDGQATCVFGYVGISVYPHSRLASRIDNSIRGSASTLREQK